MSYFIAALFILFITFCTSNARTIEEKSTIKECRINLPNEVHKDTSLLVIEGSSPTNYVYPKISEPQNLVIKSGKSIGIFCPGETNGKSSEVTKNGTIIRDGTKLSSHVSLVCQSGSDFKFDKVSVTFDEFDCIEKHGPLLRKAKLNKNICKNGKLYEAGYYHDPKNFIRTIEICHDENRADTLWAHATIQPANTEKTRYKGERESFKTGVLFKGLSMTDTYSLKTVYKNAKEILGDSVEDYFSEKTSDRKFLAKGHLIASADKLYKSEQDSTMFFANVHPMWQQVNANPGNWFMVEEYVRHLANEKARALDVWVGGVGVLKLQGNEIYLYNKDKSSEPKVPVHAVNFKAVVDISMEQAIVFVVVNNPYAELEELEDEESEYRVCKRLKTCEKIFTHWDDPARGYFYCCELSSFYKNNYKELGLEQLKEYVKFEKLELVTNDKLSEPILWNDKSVKHKESNKLKINNPFDIETPFVVTAED